MNHPSFIPQIRELIARDELKAAIDQLRIFLEKTPKLDEILHQSGRFENIRQQIRLGTVSHPEARLEQNQIRAALLDLLSEIETQGQQPALRAEMEQAVVVENSKNVVVGATITAGGSVDIGDKYTTINNEGATSGNLFSHSTLNNPVFYQNGERKIPRPLTPNPFLPEIFLGREDDLNTIHDKLFAPGGNLLLLVNGEGGVGKTSLASHYYHEYQHEYAHTAWVLSEKNIAGALLLLAPPLGVQFEETMNTEQRLERLLAAMAALDRPCLLVIDNANEVEDLQKHYLHLRRCPNFHLLLTSRITDFAQADRYRIEGLPLPEALEAFRTHYPKLQVAEEALVAQIHEAVGGNTLVLELLAKNLTQFNRLKTRYTLADLLNDLQQRGLLALTQSQAVDTAYQAKGGALRHEKPEDIIAAMYDLSDLSDEAQALLSVFAVLPAERIGFETLEALLSPRQDTEMEQVLQLLKQFEGKQEMLAPILQQAGIAMEDINNLLKKQANTFTNLDTQLLALAQSGWIEYNEIEADFKCSPVVQQITQEKNKQRLLEDCSNLVNSLIEGLDSEIMHESNYQRATQYTRYAETLLLFLKQNDAKLAILCQNIGNFHTATGDLSKAMAAYQNMADLRSGLLREDPDNASFKNGLAISYSKLGSMHTELGNLDKALTFFERYNQLAKELYEAHPTNVSFKNLLAISYSKLGETHSKMGNLDKALTFFEKYNQLERELYEAYPNNVSFKNNLAISYQFLGNTQTALGNLDRALTFFEKYNQLKKELYEAYPNNVDFKNGLAISYEKLGSTHTALGNLAKALTFFEDETKLFEELYESYPTNVSFKKGLAISYWKLGEIYSALKDTERMFTSYKLANLLCRELYLSYPQNVDFKSNLAESFLSLGIYFLNVKLDNGQAKEYFQQAEKLWMELVVDAPQFVEYKKFLDIVREKMAKLEG